MRRSADGFAFAQVKMAIASREKSVSSLLKKVLLNVNVTVSFGWAGVFGMEKVARKASNLLMRIT